VVDRLDSVLSLNAQQDNRFVGTESLVIQGTCSVMCVPLTGEGKAIGVLYVDTLSPFKQFDRDQLRLFSALGNIASGHIQRQRLLEEAILRRAYERELSQAAAIQRRLLAVEPVSRPGFAFFAANQPCLAVGGDYFDLIDCGERGVVLAIGDVCGKGMGAALLMSNLQATVRAEVRAGGGPLAIGQRVNSTLHASTDPDKFVTLFLGHLDPATGRLNYVNAGHDAPLLLRAGQDACEELAATGLPAGILPDAPLNEATVNLGPGDLLYGYTDGLREAQDPSGDEFSAERLMAALVTLRALPAPEIAEKITAEVSKFTAGGEPQDDMTQLVVRRERA
jgi:sigma-B regulation protein RsbU (phosphoserine phosphatase)